jgi:hypothetical protein
MDTEFRGPAYRALILEAAELPPAALAFRLGWDLLHRLGWRRVWGRPPARAVEALRSQMLAGAAPVGGLLAHFRDRPSPRLLADPETIVPVLQRRFELDREGRSVLVDAAHRILHQRFAFLGTEIVFEPGPIDWHAAGPDGGRWPQRPSGGLPWTGIGAPGDVKWVWELNRMQFLVTLARAWLVTGENRYARKMMALMTEWIAANPPGVGINWVSNLEVSVRAASWILALEMTRRWNGWDPEAFESIIVSLATHQDHLDRDLVYAQRWMPGNHLIGDAAGLALLALFLPELPESSRRLSRALKVLEREGPRHIHADGTTREPAVGYQRFVAEMYLMVGLALERNGRRFSPSLWDRVGRMADVALRLRSPSGRVCMIGDWDNGRFVRLDDSGPDDFGPWLSTAAVAFRRGDLKTAAKAVREDTLWMCGADAEKRFDHLPAADPPGTTGRVNGRRFEEGGLVVWRPEWSTSAEYLFFKVAPFGPHSHADNLQVLYSCHGIDWLVDRGTYKYNLVGPQWRWRAYFRGTTAHSTVVVDGEGQAIAHRGFRWLRPSVQRLHRVGAGPGLAWACGVTAGYRRLTPPVMHSRTVVFSPATYLLIVDALWATGRHRYESLWQFGPGLTVAAGGSDHVQARAMNGARLDLYTAANVPLRARVVIGEEDPIQGWHSPGYGLKEPAPTALMEANGEGMVCAATLIVSCGAGGTVPAAFPAPTLLSLSLDSVPRQPGDPVVVQVRIADRVERVHVPVAADIDDAGGPGGPLRVERADGSILVEGA